MKETDKMPARIWIDSELGMIGYVNEQPPPGSDFCHEYVRADLLQEARRAAFKEVSEIIDKAGDEWGDQARARKSKTYSAYVIAALDLKGRIEAAALEAAEKGKRDG